MVEPTREAKIKALIWEDVAVNNGFWFIADILWHGNAGFDGYTDQALDDQLASAGFETAEQVIASAEEYDKAYENS